MARKTRGAEQRRDAVTIPLKLATFQVDVSCVPGVPLLASPQQGIRAVRDPQYARGLVLRWGRRCFVLCAIDHCSIQNRAHDQLRRALGRAAGCPESHVAAHVVHQHDAAYVDCEEASLLAGRRSSRAPVEWWDQVVDRIVAATARAVKRMRAVTAVGAGSARVADCASNRRIVGSDGRVIGMRFSLCDEPRLKRRPVGLIDPMLDSLVFIGRRGPIASVSFYASHPQAAWGWGTVSADVPGEALRLLTARYPEAFHMYFTGCGANVTFGKFTTMDRERNIRVLGRRLFDGMRLAFEQAVERREPLRQAALRTRRAELPLRAFDRRQTRRVLCDGNASDRDASAAAAQWAFFTRSAKDRRALVQTLRLNDAMLLFLPSEVFVEYQLYAKGLRPDRFVAVAAYGDRKFGYVGTSATVGQGGYEADPSKGRTCPETIEPALKRLIDQMIPQH